MNSIYIAVIQRFKAGIPWQLIILNLISAFTAVIVKEMQNASTETERNNIKKYASTHIELAFKVINSYAGVENIEDIFTKQRNRLWN